MSSPKPGAVVPAEGDEGALDTLEEIGAKFDAQGMTFSRPLTVEEGRKAWLSTAALMEACQWAFGDLMIHLECRTAEHWQSINPTGRYAYEVCRQWRWVAARFPREKRFPSLTFTHHKVVAPMTPDLAHRWLKMAEKEGWSCAQLKDAIAAATDALEKEAYARIGFEEGPSHMAKDFLGEGNDHQKMMLEEAKRRAAEGVTTAGPENLPPGDHEQAQFAVDAKVAVDPVSGLLLPLAPAIVPSGRVDAMIESLARAGGSAMVSVKRVGASWVGTVVGGGEEIPRQGFHSGGPLMAIYAALDQLPEGDGQ